MSEHQLKRRTALGFAISGGGSRAAYLTAAVFREIHRTKIKTLFPFRETNTDRDLLQQVDAISAVSGGALAATYFVANFDKLTAADADSPIWEEFLNKMAISYRMREWWLNFNPVKWFQLLFTDYNRGSLAREDYEEELFGTRTLADLPVRPALFINSFDVANRARFVFSKHYFDPIYLLYPYLKNAETEASRGPKGPFLDNDVFTAKLAPSSVKLADAVYASSAYPIAYPVLPVRNCENPYEIFKGNLFFLADGGLADNSGLLSLSGRFRRATHNKEPGGNVLIIYIDASQDQIYTRRSIFQERNIEERYAWENTIFRQGKDSIEGAIDMLQEENITYLQNSGIVMSQHREDWAAHLLTRTGRCQRPRRDEWYNDFETGKIALRPLVIRLGLRDLADPFAKYHNQYVSLTRQDERLLRLLEKNGIKADVRGFPSESFLTKIRTIPTDFFLSPASRDALELAAYMLVNTKLRLDLAEWEGIAGRAESDAALDPIKLRCHDEMDDEFRPYYPGFP